ncbi:hypothetical protein SRHO_G00119000 [Serrasalmus rhombeus]
MAFKSLGGTDETWAESCSAQELHISQLIIPYNQRGPNPPPICFCRTNPAHISPHQGPRTLRCLSLGW